MLSVEVKLNGVTTLHQARYGAGIGVNYIGFPVGSKAPYRVTPEEFAAIKEWIEGPKLVIENPDDAEQCALYPGAIIETEKPALAKELMMERDIAIHAHIDDEMADWSDLIEVRKYAHIYGKDPVTPEMQQWLRIWASYAPILVGGFKFNAESIWFFTSVSECAARGITLPIVNPEKPDVNDFEHLAPIIEELETDW